MADQMLWMFASATPLDRFTPDPSAPLPPKTLLSASWRCLVLRDGVAFVGLRPDSSDEFLRNVAPGLVRSIYTDAILLGLLQRLAYHGIADELADLSADAGASRLRSVERRLSTIRNTVWGAHTTSHGFANDILRAYQDQQRLHELVDEVHVELADAARLAELDSSRRVELLLTVLTVVSAAAALAAVWTGSGVPWVAGTVGGSAVALLLYQRYIWRE